MEEAEQQVVYKYTIEVKQGTKDDYSIRAVARGNDKAQALIDVGDIIYKLRQQYKGGE